MKASLTSYNQPPRKVRLVTELVKGKSVPEAVAALSFLPKRAAEPVKKLIMSAVANSGLKGEELATLRVLNITVDSAGMLVRFMPRAMGRSAPIRRRKSQIHVTLTTEAAPKKGKKSQAPAKKAVAVEKKPVTKTAKKAAPVEEVAAETA